MCPSTCFHLKPPQPLNQWTARRRRALGCERSGQYSWLFPNTMLKDGKISDFPAVLTACWRCAWGAPGVRERTWFRSLCAYWRGWQLQKVGFMDAKTETVKKSPHNLRLMIETAFARRWLLVDCVLQQAVLAASGVCVQQAECARNKRGRTVPKHD